MVIAGLKFIMDKYKATQDQKKTEDPNCAVQPHRVHGSECVRVDFLPHIAEREAIITRVRKGNATGRDHAPLAHAEARVGADASLRARGRDGARGGNVRV